MCRWPLINSFQCSLLQTRRKVVLCESVGIHICQAFLFCFVCLSVLAAHNILQEQYNIVKATIGK